MGLTYTKCCIVNVWSLQEKIRLLTVEIKGNVTTSGNYLLLFGGCVSCYRDAGITDLLISCYHQSAGSPPAPGIWLTDNKSSRLAITLSYAALGASGPSSLSVTWLPLFSETSFLYLLDLLLYTFHLSLLP